MRIREILSTAAAFGLCAFTAHAQTRPTTPFTAESIEPLELFHQACFDGQIMLGRAQIEGVRWNDIPDNLSFMNTYNHDGVFFRTTRSTQYIAITSGASHADPAKVDGRCAIATRKIGFEDAANALKDQYDLSDPIELPIEGETVSLFVGSQGVISLSQAGGEWVILRRLQNLIGVSAEDAKVTAEGKKFE